MLIRPVTDADHDALWTILEPTIRAGETYALDRDLSRADALAYWCGRDRETFVSETDGGIMGTYYIRPNQSGGGRHVGNCGYMTRPDATGRGVASAMVAHSLDHARARGYRAMQFNLVVSTNTRAISLWERHGFRTLARLPGVFLHPVAGYVDTLVMFQDLVPS